MKTFEGLLKLRAHIKGKKPNFIRQDAHKKKKLAKNWRQPKGIHSKARKKMKGHRKQPSMGYRSSKKVRFLTSNGLREKIVYNVNDLKDIKDNETVVIAKSVGLRKKIEVLKKIKELRLNLSNIKDIDSFLKRAEEIHKKAKPEIKAEKEQKEVKKVEPTKEKIKNKEELEKKKILEKRRAK